MSIELELPGVEDRLTVIGRTGSGKTQGAAFVLSRSPFHRQPYIMLNFKSDKMLDSIPRVRRLTFEDELPKYPGVYMLTPTPETDNDKIEAWLRKVWVRQKIGLFLDEAYEISRWSRAFNSILKQGRSRRIPVIACTQRPVELSRSVFTEADYTWLFHLQHQRDIKTVAEFIPPDIIPDRIPEYCSVWFDVKRNTALRLNPVPDAETILATFEDRLRPRHKFF